MTASVVQQILDRAGDPGFDRWWAQVTGAGYCACPVHLRSDGAAPGALLARCKNRRAAVCPSCSQLYSGDIWRLVHEGIAPGSDDTPLVFGTLTAPSFGAVHGLGRSPRPTGGAEVCVHGALRRCRCGHADDDPAVGQAVCPDCYDYDAHIRFTWHAPELWHRYAIHFRRSLRRSLRDRADGSGWRLEYLKVVELQRRGLPHFHFLGRLDGDLPIGAAELATIARAAVASVELRVVLADGSTSVLRFGEQTAVDLIGLDDGRRVAAYLAKYVTKSVADFGIAPRRMSDRAIEHLDVTDHHRRILRAAVRLARQPGYAAVRNWLHTLGYRGHVVTKTRGYSTTLAALRARRHAWRQDRDVADPTDGGWTFDGYGHATAGDRLLVVTAAEKHREMRSVAREETADHPDL